MFEEPSVKILFVIDRRAYAGSIQAVSNYIRVGDQMGHTFALYGREDPQFPDLRCSTDLSAFDYLVFIAEFGIGWMSGLRMPRVLFEVARERRAILDADGMYNQIITIDGYDRNHANEHDRLKWVGHCDALADKILQPTFQPCEPGVLGVPFYGYNPEAQIRADASPPKRFDIVHLAHNWWRWREVRGRLLPAIERIRPQVGDICFVGSWWDMVPAGARDQNVEVAFGVDTERFRRLHIQVRPAVPYTQVIPAMSEGRVNLLTQRPLFRRLQLLTSKYFEIFSADTVPLLMLDADHAESVYGPAGRELALDGRIEEKLLDALRQPRRYQDLVHEVRGHLAVHHSYQARIQELVAALKA